MFIFGIVKKFAHRDEEITTDLPEGVYDREALRRDICPHMMYDASKPFCKGLIFPAACNKIYKRSLLLAHHCTDTRIRMGEDNAFVYECVWHADSICVCNRILYFYNRLNETAIGNSYDAGRFENNQLLTAYLEQRLGGLDPVLDEQLNAFKAYWLIMAVFHEIKSGRPIKTAAPHIREKIEATGVLKGIHLGGLPLMAKAFMLLLKLRLYWLTLLASAVVNKKRES